MIEIRPTTTQDFLDIDLHEDHMEFSPMAQYESMLGHAKGEFTAETVLLDGEILYILGVTPTSFGDVMWTLTSNSIAKGIKYYLRHTRRTLAGLDRPCVFSWVGSKMINKAIVSSGLTMRYECPGGYYFFSRGK